MTQLATGSDFEDRCMVAVEGETDAAGFWHPVYCQKVADVVSLITGAGRCAGHMPGGEDFQDSRRYRREWAGTGLLFAEA